jgi:hypothetical protein
LVKMHKNIYSVLFTARDNWVVLEQGNAGTWSDS